MNISHVRWIRSASPDTDAVLAHAGHELARYGRRLTGSRWDAAAATCVTQEGQTVWLGIVDQLPAPPAGRALTPDPWDGVTSGGDATIPRMAIASHTALTRSRGRIRST